ncbi:ABC transporter substrate-binding protein [Mesorhizobium australicum]|uniref:NitT/TauT family transport system substrate-binding protein n=1 Tax=Mesorhizobium australicum TaxID=536018 RepID=A0A1X7MW59_9HYPH|nr:ABC transporter substrate-binding protein [Mesorhizobium australicum]SMH28174.1 NitT/TauT family transport system substrate-binding protein [Mesorhizobium australicum]
MTRKLLMSVAALAVAAGSILSTAARAADDVTLMLDWTPGGLAGAWYLGAKNGCFGDKGINLTVERGYGGGDTVTKIAAGVAPFGTADLSSIMLGKITAGAKVKAIMPIYSTSPVAVAVLADSGIGKIADLEGKTIAHAPGDSGIKILPIAFGKAGADFAKVKVETVEAATLSGLLIQGQVNAITTFVTTAMLINAAAQKAGKEVKTINFASELGVYSNSLLASEDTIAKNPALVARFKEAAICSFEAAKADPDGAVEAMNAVVGGLDMAVHTGIAKAALPLVFEDAKFKASGFGWNMDGVAATLDVAKQAQGVTTDLTPADFIYEK